MPRGYLSLSAGPRSGGRRRLVRLAVLLDLPPGGRSSHREEGARHLTAFLTRRGAGRPVLLRCASLKQAGAPGAFSGETSLAPGDYRLTSPESPGLSLDFRLPSGPRAPLRLFCPHPGPGRSFTETVSAQDSGGGRGAEIRNSFRQSCCGDRRFSAGEGTDEGPRETILFIPQEGILESVVDGRRLAARKGEYILVPPLSRNQPPRERQMFPLRLKTVMFPPGLLLGFCQAAGLTNGFRAFSFPPGPHRMNAALASAVDDLEEALKTSDALAASHEAHLAAHRVLLALARQHSGKNSPIGPAAPFDREKETLDRAVAFFRSRYREPCRIELAARHAGVSVSGLRRIFRRYLNRSPNAFLQGVRIEAAKKLLQDPDRKLSEIAEAVGYADVRHFRRVFKTHTRKRTGAFRLS